MSLRDYKEAQRLRDNQISVEALLMAVVLRGVDAAYLGPIEKAFPSLVAEVRKRYTHGINGRLPEDEPEPKKNRSAKR